MFPKKLTFLPPDTYTYLCVSGVKNVSSLENSAYILNGDYSLRHDSVREIKSNPVFLPQETLMAD